ncbi:hypothetical protein E2C01_039466 [Portunus trituberculatus]|uniref:Uncharacterized protein n=1 Tax=Portunus trituberculatus TaxID=210409 RepID=A0A5B7FKU2_PORTR|nr:hypothetical protein [Portunus trituberculatus]
MKVLSICVLDHCTTYARTGTGFPYVEVPLAFCLCQFLGPEEYPNVEGREKEEERREDKKKEKEMREERSDEIKKEIREEERKSRKRSQASLVQRCDPLIGAVLI